MPKTINMSYDSGKNKWGGKIPYKGKALRTPFRTSIEQAAADVDK